MSDGITIKIEGIKELQNAFKLIDSDMQKILSDSIKKGGDVVKFTARGKVHVITGRLRESINELHVNESKNKVEVMIGSTVTYAEEEEFRIGGKYPGPHSYLRWSLDTSESQIESAVKNSISTRLKRF